MAPDAQTAATDPAAAVRAARSLCDGGPRDINAGRCGEFAHALVMDPGGPGLDGRIASAGPADVPAGHTWVVFDGRHYDAECEEGADDWRDLPFFRREWTAPERGRHALTGVDEHGFLFLEPLP